MKEIWANYIQNLIEMEPQDEEKILKEHIDEQMEIMRRALNHLKGIKLYLEKNKKKNSQFYKMLDPVTRIDTL